MPAETARYIKGLDDERPGMNEPISDGDDHLRLIKHVLKETFPEADGPQAPMAYPQNEGSVVRSNGSKWEEVTNVTIDGSGNVECESLTARGDVSALSDERLKARQETIDGALEKIKGIDTFTYVPNEEGLERGMPNIVQAGVSAQQVQAVFPHAVKETYTGYLAVDYSRLCVLLLEAVKELSDKLENQA